MMVKDQRTYRQVAIDAAQSRDFEKAKVYALLAQEQAQYESRGIARPTLLPMRRVALIFMMLLVPTLASAQYQLQFTTNADHTSIEHGTPVIASYEMVLTPAGGGAANTLNLGKPTPVSNVVTADVDAFVSKMPAGAYTLVVRAIGPGGTTPSAAVPFSAAPRAPGAVTETGITRAPSSGLSRTPSLSKPLSLPVPVKK